MGRRVRSVRKASVSWTSPRESARVPARISKISGGRTYRPMMARRAGGPSGPAPGQDFEDRGWQDVPADDGQVGRRVLRARLLGQVEDLVHPAADRLRGDHAVLRDPVAGHALDREYRGLVPLGDVEELPHTRRRRRADDVVAEEHAEGLVADQRAGTEDGVAEPERLLLTDVGDRRQLGDGLDLRELFRFAPVAQVVLELERRVEVVLDRALASPGHDD